MSASREYARLSNQKQGLFKEALGNTSAHRRENFDFDSFRKVLFKHANSIGHCVNGITREDAKKHP
jgi:hypothetical protein